MLSISMGAIEQVRLSSDGRKELHRILTKKKKLAIEEQLIEGLERATSHYWMMVNASAYNAGIYNTEICAKEGICPCVVDQNVLGKQSTRRRLDRQFNVFIVGKRPIASLTKKGGWFDKLTKSVGELGLLAVFHRMQQLKEATAPHAICIPKTVKLELQQLKDYTIASISRKEGRPVHQAVLVLAIDTVTALRNAGIRPSASKSAITWDIFALMLKETKEGTDTDLAEFLNPGGTASFMELPMLTHPRRIY